MVFKKGFIKKVLTIEKFAPVAGRERWNINCSIGIIPYILVNSNEELIRNAEKIIETIMNIGLLKKSIVIKPLFPLNIIWAKIIIKLII